MKIMRLIDFPRIFILLMAFLLTCAGLFRVIAAERDTQTLAVSLEDCLRLGLENSTEIKLAAENVAIAKEGIRQAEAGLWPVLNYQAGYQQTGSSDISGALKLDMPLYTGGKVGNNIKIARLKLSLTKEEERKTRLNLRYNIKKAFYALWLSEQKLQVIQASYNNLQEHYERVAKNYKLGTASKYDMFKAEVQWKGQKPQVITATNELTQARLSLAILLGIDQKKAIILSYDNAMLKIPDQVNQALPALLEVAYRQRPEITQSGQKAEIAKLNVAVSKAGYLPTISLNSTYQSQGSDLALTEWNQTWKLTLGLSGPIFDGFATDAKVKEAEHNVTVVTLTDQKLRDQIRTEVDQAFQDLTQNIAVAGANQAYIDLAKETLKMTQSRFNLGSATSIEIMDAQLAVDQAQNGYYQGVAAYLTAQARLDLVLGNE